MVSAVGCHNGFTKEHNQVGVGLALRGAPRLLGAQRRRLAARAQRAAATRMRARPQHHASSWQEQHLVGPASIATALVVRPQDSWLVEDVYPAPALAATTIGVFDGHGSQVHRSRGLACLCLYFTRTGCAWLAHQQPRLLLLSPFTARLTPCPPVTCRATLPRASWPSTWPMRCTAAHGRRW